MTATIRRLSPTARVLTDDHGGWRLEKTFSTGSLQSVEDQFGLIVDVVRDSNDRPVGVNLGVRLALEYIYAEKHGPWQKKVLYDPETQAVVAEASNTRANEDPGAQREGLVSSPRSTRDPMIEAGSGRGSPPQIIISVEGTRYASLPLEGRGPVSRSVQIDILSAGNESDRIEYTDSELVIHLSTGDRAKEVAVAISRHGDRDGSPIVITNSNPGFKRHLTALTKGVPHTASRNDPEPSRHGSLSSSVTEVLARGYALALDRVRNLPSCRSLFEPYSYSGNERLMSTFYSPPRPNLPDNSCNKNALAFTHVGSPVTHLCTGFEKLSSEQAAIVLIHEALHFAGMPEAPSTSGALTSKEISELVHGACGF